jgi:hypothetical protein
MVLGFSAIKTNWSFCMQQLLALFEDILFLPLLLTPSST